MSYNSTKNNASGTNKLPTRQATGHLTRHLTRRLTKHPTDPQTAPAIVPRTVWRIQKDTEVIAVSIRKMYFVKENCI